MTHPTLSERLQSIRERLEKATPYDEKPGSKCPECGFETYGYRHKYDCDLSKHHLEIMKHARTDIEKLLKEREILWKALEFYADYSNWVYEDDDDVRRCVILGSDVARSEFKEEKDLFGGKRARQAQKEVEEVWS